MQPANLHTLTQVRSSKVAAVLAYLQQVADEAAKLPAYFPDHLKTPNTGEILPFDSIRQQLKVIEDRSELHQRLARINEQRRASGQDDQIYAPRRYNGLEEEHQQKTVTFSWDHKALNRHQRMAILGDPGYGKSWLLRYEARRSAIEQIKKMAEHQLTMEALVLPVCLPLASIANYLPDDTKTIEHRTIENALAYHVQTRAPKIHEHEQTYDLTALFKEKLLSWNCLLLLDAWDEVADEKRDVLFKGLVEFFESYRKPKVLLTSRIVGYFNQTRLAGFQEAELLGFDPKHSRAVARLWFKGQESALEQFEVATRQQSGIRHLLRIPLLLTLALRAHQSHYSFPDKVSVQPDFFPTRRVELYSHCLNALAIDWQEEKNHLPENELKVKKLLRKTALAAFKLTERQRESFSKLEFVQALGENDTDEVIDFIDSLLKIGILVRIGDHSSAPMIFLHRTFQEYLTALHLSNLANQQGWASIEAIVEQWSWQPEKDVILELLAGLLVDPAPILDHLADDKTDGYFRGRLALAARCLKEIETNKLQLIETKVINIADEVIRLVEGNYLLAERIYMPPKVTNIALVILEKFKPHINYGSKFVSHLIRNGQTDILAELDTNMTIPSLLAADIDDAKITKMAFAEILSYPGSVVAVDVLLTALRDTDEYVRSNAAYALGKLGSEASIPDLLASLWDENDEVRESAADALGVIGSEKAINGLLSALNDPDSGVRMLAASAIGEIGSEISIPGLMSALLDSDKYVRECAVTALGNIGSDEAISMLKALLVDSNNIERNFAALALGKAGSVTAIPNLLAALQDTDHNVRASAAFALGKIGSEMVIPSLLITLQDTDDEVVWRGAQALKRLGYTKTAITSIPKLLIKLKDSEGYLRWRLVSALGMLGSETAIDGLWYAHLNSSGYAGCVAEALGEIGSKKAIDWLLILLKNGVNIERESAASALGKIGSEAAIPGLLAALKDADANVRKVAALSLGNVGLEVSIPELCYSLWDANFFVAMNAAYALYKIGSKDAILALCQWLIAIDYESEEFCRNEIRFWVLNTEIARRYKRNYFSLIQN